MKPDWFTVMTYNIRYDNPEDGENAWDNRKQAIVELVERDKPHFIGFQEVNPKQLEYLAANLSCFGYYYAGEGRNGGNNGEFTPIFWNSNEIDIIDSGTFWLTNEPHQPSKLPCASLPRICTWGKFQKKKFRYFCFI